MRRTWWFGAGYAAGIGTAVWLRTKARQTAERYAPANVRQDLTDRSRDVAGRARQTASDSARSLGREARRIVEDVRDAVAEGREAMHRTESELSDDETTARGDGAQDRIDQP